MRVVVANAKGGVGKTTTAVMLACAMKTRLLEAAVLDADPQASATLWASLASEAGTPLPFDVVPANLVTLGRKSPEGELELVDCPPSGRTFDKAVSSADFVIVPSSESSTDLQQSWATLEAVPEGIPAAILLCRAEERTRAYREAVNALTTLKSPRFDTVIPKCQYLKNVFGHCPDRLAGYGEVLSELLQELVRAGVR